ncbi:MAG: hypothetical protein Q8P05_04990 [Candidatus Diapherotrites archaeon]|nr:hypothetical protein [Candidatus Diapherotrites archaeon]MDZ4256444.1 hypothetical protein [archaeon]
MFQSPELFIVFVTQVLVIILYLSALVRYTRLTDTRSTHRAASRASPAKHSSAKRKIRRKSRV